MSDERIKELCVIANCGGQSEMHHAFWEVLRELKAAREKLDELARFYNAVREQLRITSSWAHVTLHNHEEQLGECGHLHCQQAADILRHTLAVAERAAGEKGEKP
jgi:hypothetical protein